MAECNFDEMEEEIGYEAEMRKAYEEILNNISTIRKNHHVGRRRSKSCMESGFEHDEELKKDRKLSLPVYPSSFLHRDRLSSVDSLDYQLAESCDFTIKTSDYLAAQSKTPDILDIKVKSKQRPEYELGVCKADRKMSLPISLNDRFPCGEDVGHRFVSCHKYNAEGKSKFAGSQRQVAADALNNNYVERVGAPEFEFSGGHKGARKLSQPISPNTLYTRERSLSCTLANESKSRNVPINNTEKRREREFLSRGYNDARKLSLPISPRSLYTRERSLSCAFTNECTIHKDFDNNENKRKGSLKIDLNDNRNTSPPRALKSIWLPKEFFRRTRSASKCSISNENRDKTDY